MVRPGIHHPDDSTARFVGSEKLKQRHSSVPNGQQGTGDCPKKKKPLPCSFRILCLIFHAMPLPQKTQMVVVFVKNVLYVFFFFRKNIGKHDSSCGRAMLPFGWVGQCRRCNIIDAEVFRQSQTMPFCKKRGRSLGTPIFRAKGTHVAPS